MRIVFLRISSMWYYKGSENEPEPAQNGGSYVKKHGFGHEEYNFNAFLLNGSEEPMCLGFFETKSSGGIKNAFHIEKIKGCGAYRNEPFVDDVLVIWCAVRNQGMNVVGWYKHARVYRYYQNWIMGNPDGFEEERCYNVEARAQDCVLLPLEDRNRSKWSVKTKEYARTFGFGQKPMVWYPTEPEAADYLKRLQDSIDTYSGENHLFVYPVTDH